MREEVLTTVRIIAPATAQIKLTVNGRMSEEEVFTLWLHGSRLVCPELEQLITHTKEAMIGELDTK